MAIDGTAIGSDAPSARVTVVVRGPDRLIYENQARVELRRRGPGPVFELRRGEDGLYTGAVPAGVYELTVSALPLVAPPQRVTARAEPVTVPAYLGGADWPFYRIGPSPIPFPPPDGLLAVAFPLGRPPEDVAVQIGETLIDARDLAPVQVEARRDLPSGIADFRNANDAVWLFRLPAGADQATAIERAAEFIRERTDHEVRVGVPVDLTPGRVSVIDTTVAVRFADSIDEARIDQLLIEARAKRIRARNRAGRISFLLRLPGHPEGALDRLEQWYQGDLLAYGEPVLMTQITYGDPGPTAGAGQISPRSLLDPHKVTGAREVLEKAQVNPYGDPGISVATIDAGIQRSHPDISGPLSDGSPRIAVGYDFVLNRDLLAMSDTDAEDYRRKLQESHGMGILGLIAAQVGNSIGMDGIAPNTRQICIRGLDITSQYYPDTLLWAAGLSYPDFPASWPTPPTRGADVICCAHNHYGHATPAQYYDEFDDVAKYSRAGRGRGVVVVCSAGNHDHLITGYAACGDYSKNLAAANSLPPDPQSIERRAPNSSYGPEVAVCAQGEGSTSLDTNSGVQTAFGGTSAAAAILTGVVALVLSKDPTLDADQVRHFLTTTADRIDGGNSTGDGRWVGSFSNWYGYGRVNAENAVAAV